MVRPDPSMFQSKMVDIQIPMPWYYSILFIAILIGYVAFLATAAYLHASYYIFDNDNYLRDDGYGLETLFISQVLLFLALIFVGQKADTTIRGNIRKIKEQAPTRDSKIRMEAGGVELQSFWRGAYVHRPSSDDLGWVFDPPQMEHWSASKSIFQADESGLIKEHPSIVGTPTPPDFTTNGILVIMSFLPLIGIGLTVPPMVEAEARVAFIIIPILFLIFAVISHFVGASERVAIEHVTEKVRSVAVGDTELVGQVRNLGQIPIVVVDNDPSKSAEDLLLWEWLYDVEIEEEYRDSKGNRQTRRYWRTIDSDAGGSQFVLHDGTGGIVVETNSFSRKSLGQPMITWSCSHASYSQLKSLNLWKAVRTYGSGTVKQHRWRLWGLGLGDPCMIHGAAKTMPNEQIENYGISNTDPPCSRLVMLGEDSETMKAKIWRGSELTNITLAESSFETTTIPVVMMLVATTFSTIFYLVG
ncbi:MAG: hypothetical protein VYE39_02340 [Candidatus Thermoplasmatota archaeon]|nr:hypothetical protein [Candidatus Thermoplasmatota archaeon]